MKTKTYIPPVLRTVNLQLERTMLQSSGYDEAGHDYNNDNDLGELV